MNNTVLALITFSLIFSFISIGFSAYSIGRSHSETMCYQKMQAIEGMRDIIEFERNRLSE